MLADLPPILAVSLALVVPSSASAASTSRGRSTPPRREHRARPGGHLRPDGHVAKDLRLQGEGVAFVLAPSAPGSEAIILVTGPVEVTIAGLRLDLGTAPGGTRAGGGRARGGRARGLWRRYDPAERRRVRKRRQRRRARDHGQRQRLRRMRPGSGDRRRQGGRCRGARGRQRRERRHRRRQHADRQPLRRAAVAAPRMDVLSTTMSGDAGNGVGVLDCDAACGGGAQATQGVVDGSTITGHGPDCSCATWSRVTGSPRLPWCGRVAS